jgi:hypothetical protein
MKVALKALHEVLVAARNIDLENPGSRALADIVDSIEAVPLWMADEDKDRGADFMQVLDSLASEYPECRMAATTALALRTEQKSPPTLPRKIK